MLLHVGGGQWYKNLIGVVAIYARYASRVAEPLALWCVSPPPNAALRQALSAVPGKGQVHFVSKLDSRALQAMYSLARAMLFPSLAEGFGWPLIEAQACGCPVVTTNEPPMNEVAGPAAVYIPRLKSMSQLGNWADEGAAALNELLSEGPTERACRVESGKRWAKRFDARNAIDEYLVIYQRIIEGFAAPGSLQRGAGASVQF